jgi:hypothetical protein
LQGMLHIWNIFRLRCALAYFFIHARGAKPPARCVI